MSPELFTKIENDPVAAIEELLHLTDPARTTAVIDILRRIINNKPASHATARHIGLTAYTPEVDTDIALTKTEIAKQAEVTVSSISQTSTRLASRIEEVSTELGDHKLIAYISESVGRIARLGDLPRWIQAIVLTRPSSDSHTWGTTSDIAQFVSKLALKNRLLVYNHNSSTGTQEMWITEDGIPVTDALDFLTDEITELHSISTSADQLRSLLVTHGVAPTHVATIETQLIQTRNAIWLPSAQCYIMFNRTNKSSRKSRGNAPDRARDILQLVTHVDLPILRDDIIEQFVSQHGLGQATAENAVMNAGQ